MQGIKKYYFLLFVSLFCYGISIVKAQQYNNEWINYSRTYYKFKLAETGLCRIGQSVLSAAGLGTVPAEQFQLWRNGQQIPLYTSVSTGAFGASDYIEFWGEQNDGVPDQKLYREPVNQYNGKWSLETDTVAYFLTVNPSLGNLRLVPTANALPSSLAPDAFFNFTTGVYYKEKINDGYAVPIGSYAYSSAYDAGEGFTSADIAAGQNRTEQFNNLFAYTGTSAPSANLKVNLVGNAPNPRTIDVQLNNTSYASQSLDHFSTVSIASAIPVPAISAGSASIKISNTGSAGNDRLVIAKIELSYARRFDFGNVNQFLFELAPNLNGNYLEISGFNHGGAPPIIYDLTNGKRYAGDISTPSLVKVMLQPSVVKRKLLILSSTSVSPIAITALQFRQFVNYLTASNQGDYLIISHNAFTTGTSAGNPLDNYRAYRASSIGGSYNAKIYFIDQLEDQFAYGIKQHPFSIVNFLRWARANFTSPIKSVFLIGKGISYNDIRRNESNPQISKLAFLPTFGWPASDILLTAEPGLDETPLLPIGRLSVINGDEISLYLNKVREYEQKIITPSPYAADKAWMKNVAHIIGTSDEGLASAIGSTMNRFGDIIIDTFYGANISTFTKVSPAAVVQANSAKLYSLFETGIGMLTYFGHSAATALDYNLDSPEGYNNPGKYPLMLLLGCRAGNFFTFNPVRLLQNETISEKFVLAPNRGAIATFAASSIGLVNYLELHNTNTMTAMSVSMYGKTMGEIMRESVRKTWAGGVQDDFLARAQCEETSLHGDPALRLSASFPKPDYVIEESMLQINPGFISVAENNFTIKANLMNIGKVVNKRIVVEIKRTYPNGQTDIIKRDTINGIKYEDSLQYILPIIPTRDKGLNKISVSVDADNAVDEIYETNNTVAKDIYIYEDELRPVYPSNYAIVNRQGIKLQASTANPIANQRNYRMELDTTALFNSPFKITQTVSSSGGVVEFNPGFNFSDSTVYYWRVAPVPSSGSPIWNSSSFIYLNGSDAGYNQSHLYQHTQSLSTGMKIDSVSRKWKYDSIINTIDIRTGVIGVSSLTVADFQVTVNGRDIIRGRCNTPTLVFNVFHPITFQPWVNSLVGGNSQFGSDPTCENLRMYNFQFSLLDTAKRRKIAEFMDLVPDGYIVVVRNATGPELVGNSFSSDWASDFSFMGVGNSFYEKLRVQGFTDIDSFNRPRAFAFIYKKNRQAEFVPKSKFTAGTYDLINLTANFKTPDSVGGRISSPVFGPMKSWKKLKWRGSLDSPVFDSVGVEVYGVRSDGVEDRLFGPLSISQQDLDISSINASTYPNLRLKLTTIDTSLFTPYQLRYWRLTGMPIPEGAMSPNIFSSIKDTVDAGEPFDYKIAFKNISDASFDSLKVKLTITDKNNVTRTYPLVKRKPLAIGDTLQLGALIKTESLSGVNTVFLEANPDNDQLEQYHFNNFIYKSLFVRPDTISPVLDVAFDGVHILNEDIVSSKPNILIKLKDESKWMLLNDTSLFTIQVKHPDGVLHRYNFNNDTLRFIPATQGGINSNAVSIEFTPNFLVDGLYELIVSAKDKSNNQAGQIAYRVVFSIINKAMISNLLNYPNPFTSSTAFVFTLTGNEIPEQFKIEILTITGKIVREITKEELGPIHLGRNITSYKWDGTDQYGQPLGNGVYLYRVVTKLHGSILEKYRAAEDNTDKYFNKGYGKMYLMR
jgi:hypothetical protein